MRFSNRKRLSIAIIKSFSFILTYLSFFDDKSIIKFYFLLLIKISISFVLIKTRNYSYKVSFILLLIYLLFRIFTTLFLFSSFFLILSDSAFFNNISHTENLQYSIEYIKNQCLCTKQYYSIVKQLSKHINKSWELHLPMTAPQSKVAFAT